MFHFIGEIFLRAFFASVAAMGTTALAVCGGVAAFLFILLRRLRFGLKEMARHWKETAKDGAIGALIWWGMVFCYQLFYRIPREITAQADHISAPPHLSTKSHLPPSWDDKFTKPFCYVMFETVRPQLIDGRFGFPLLVLSNVKRAWDGVAVRIRRPDQTQFLVNQEVGTLRLEGAVLNRLFFPDINQPYLVVVLTRSRPDYFYETLTLTQTNGGFEQQIQVYRVQQHGSPRLFFDSVARGRLP
jgi:hypothetical protein